MKQLLVRNLDEGLVRKLKTRARAHGVSAEEEHRRILKEALSRRPDKTPSLIEFLCASEVAPDIELDFGRSRKIEERDTGL